MIRCAVRLMERVHTGAWRWIATLYWIALTLGTHWPSLRVGQPGPIPVDKILHAVAFCGLAGLLMLTRWFDRRAAFSFESGNINRSCLAAVVLAAIDESSQSWAWFDRFARLDDFIADLLGIAVAWTVAMLLFRRHRADDTIHPESPRKSPKNDGV